MLQTQLIREIITSQTLLPSHWVLKSLKKRKMQKIIMY